MGKDRKVKSHPGRVIKMLISLLNVAKHRFPGARIHFSGMFPRTVARDWKPEQYLTKVNYINGVMREKCRSRGWGFVPHQNFWIEKLEPMARFFLADGLHLNTKGREIAVRNFQESLYKRPF